MALGPGDEEGRGIGRANVVEVAGDAEWLGGPLPASLGRVQPTADEYQPKNTRQSQEDRQPVSLGELGQQAPSGAEILSLSYGIGYASRTARRGSRELHRVRSAVQSKAFDA